MDSQVIVIENEKGIKRNYEVYFTFIVDEVEYIISSQLNIPPTLSSTILPSLRITTLCL